MGTMRGLFGLFSVLALGAGPSLAQTLTLDGGTFNESLRPTAEISGAIVAGLQIHSKSTLSAGFDPVLPAGMAFEEPFCVRVISANGLYDAVNQYSFSDKEATERPVINITARSEHKEFWEGLEGPQVAASISLGTCDETPRAFVLASWEEGEAAEALLYVNSLRADAVVLRDLGTGDTIRCSAIEIDVRSAYDTMCPVVIEGRSGTVEIEIVRFVNRQPSAPANVTLILSGD